jgi:MoaA/NifB/PqqE/SkfB family radical SAM enzyme
LQINHELLSLVEEREVPETLSTLPILVLHAHSSCNCRCIMCDIWKTRDQKKIGVREIEAQLESIRRLGVRWIVFSGGEPLMNSELPEMCALLRAEGIRLTLLSTGLLLKKCAAKVVEGFKDVIVSLDGPREIHDGIRRVPGAFDLLHEGIRALRNMRPDIKITARSTVQKANHGHLMETVHAAKELQLDGISFLAVDVTSTAFNRSLVWPVSRQTEIGLSLAELGALENEIESLIAASGRNFEAGFVAESPQKLLRIARHFRAQLGLAEAESPLCNAPWVSAVIEADGSVRPCFFHPSIGNLNGTTLEAVINGPEGRGFRSTLDVANNPICRNCVCSLNYRT